MEKKENLPILSINRQYLNNTKIGRIIATKKYPDITDKGISMKVAIKENIVNLVNLNTDPNITLTDSNITQFDMAVMDAVYTIISAGVMVVTPEWICKVLSGNMSQRATPRKVHAVVKSLEKLRSIHIRIDCKEQANVKEKEKKYEELVYQSYLLPLSSVEARLAANGREVRAYTVLEKPALYCYAESLHQLIDVPAELMDTHELFADTDNAILIKRYVIKRVMQMRNEKNRLFSNKISFYWKDKETGEERGLFPELGYVPDNSEEWHKKKNRIIQVVCLTLDMMKEKEIITGYEKYRKSGSKNPTFPVMGVQVFFGDSGEKILLEGKKGANDK